MTNLMDEVKYPSNAVREMYRRRWQVEVDLRTIKSFMELEVYRGECPTQGGDEAAILLGEE